MKNLNELGVQEMDAIEVKKTDGGFILEGLAVGYLGFMIIEGAKDPKGVWDGIVDCFN